MGPWALYLLYFISGPRDIIPLQQFWPLGLRNSTEGSPTQLVPWEGTPRCPAGRQWPKPTPVLWELLLGWCPGLGLLLSSPAALLPGWCGGTCLAAGHALPTQGRPLSPWSPRSSQQVPLEMSALLTYSSPLGPIVVPAGRPAAVHGPGRPHH